MVLKPEQQEQQHQLRMLLTEAITTLCQKGLNYRSHFNVEGLLGITLDDDEVFLVNIQKTVTEQDSDESPAELSKDAFMKNNQPNPFVDSNNAPVSRAKQRKKRKRSTDSIERVAPSNVALNNNNIEKKNSNVPIEIKPVDAWEEGNKLNRNKDTFDDTASSPGELIVVREDLSDNEQSDYPFNNQDKQAQHSRAAQEEDQKNATAGGSAIYASSNGQMGAPRTSPFQGAWDDPGRSFAQQQQTRVRAGCQATTGGGAGGDVILDARDDVIVARDGNVSGAEGGESAATTGVVFGNLQTELARYSPPENTRASLPDYTPPPPSAPSNGGSSRRKRKSAVVMRRGIPSTSPRSIPQVTSSPEGNSPPGRGNDPYHSDVVSNGSSSSLVPYYCQICKKTFSRPFSWKVHMNVHMGIFPYTCNECGKGFTSHINLKGHQVQHTNRREYKCGACGKEFIYKRGLNAHIPICKNVQ